ncbi:MAG: DUF2723 domain-containing protein [Elusimicrobia bacterium]|nr:DUF2723 domain-containing protein [Candidatus Obscuribacterium magneticum]
MLNRKILFGFFLFIGFFALYLHTAAPQVAPYRDTGEMAVLIHTLGVAHPPGYPLYTLASHIFKLIPLGNPAYRGNLFSAFVASLALVFLYEVLTVWLGLLPAVLSTAAYGLTTRFWELASVSEMYTFGIFWVCLLLLVLFRYQNILLTALLVALGLGIRMDLMLVIPVLGLYLWLEKRRIHFLHAMVFFSLGIGIFLYLPLRSMQNPIIDWGNPESLGTLINSLTRKSYSGTLDLLSLSYKMGENFPANMALYGKNVGKAFGWWGFPFILVGFVALFRDKRNLGLLLTGLFVVSGPLFIFLANMPPNPHAVAIIEAAYPLPDLMLAMALGFGIQYVYSRVKEKAKLLPACLTGLFVILLASNAFSNQTVASKRRLFYLRDYNENVWRSTPRNAVLIFHKDVQLMSLWASQLIEKRRPDVSLVASGLSTSPWFWEMKKRWKTASSPAQEVKTPEGLAETKRLIGDRRLMIGYETDFVTPPGFNVLPHGLVLELLPSDTKPNEKIDALLPEVCLYRGPYRYGETPDFFSTDLIGDTARAYQRFGYQLLLQGFTDAAQWYLKRAESLDPTYARASSDRCYLYLITKDYARAVEMGKRAVEKNKNTLKLAADFKSLPDVVNAFRHDLSNAYLYLGSAGEKAGDLELARRSYQNSYETYPNAQAAYNLGVTYWGKDWGAVIDHLRKALSIDPNNSDARHFLQMAIEKSEGK